MKTSGTALSLLLLLSSLTVVRAEEQDLPVQQDFTEHQEAPEGFDEQHKARPKWFEKKLAKEHSLIFELYLSEKINTAFEKELTENFPATYFLQKEHFDKVLDEFKEKVSNAQTIEEKRAVVDNFNFANVFAPVAKQAREDKLKSMYDDHVKFQEAKKAWVEEVQERVNEYFESGFITQEEYAEILKDLGIIEIGGEEPLEESA